MSDDDGNDEEGRERTPSVSRIGFGGPRRYRTLSRFRTSERFPRQKRRLAIAELLGLLIKHHGLTDECRQQFVCIYWSEIVGERFATRSWPIRFSEGMLHVETDSSSWVHELQFHKATLIAKINAWVDANRVWLGPAPLVADMRFELGGRRRQTPIVDRDHVGRLEARHIRRLSRPSPLVSACASESERDGILAETIAIVDPELRGIVESVRLKWNR